MCAPHRDKSNFRLNRQFSFHRYILEVLAEEVIKFLFMQREICDYHIVMGKTLREDKALNTVYFEKMQ